MGVLIIKQGLTITGVLPVNSNERGIVMGSTCSYHALHALITPYHPSLGNDSLFSAIPEQGPTETTQTYILRIMSYARQEHVAGRIYSEKDISRMILQNLRANIRDVVQPLLCPRLMQGSNTDPCPIDLTAHHIGRTIEATLLRSGEPCASSTPAYTPYIKRPVVHSLDAAASHGSFPWSDDDIIAGALPNGTKLTIHQVLDNALRKPMHCGICDVDTHTTNTCN
jgi:hypothetical protein